MAFIFQSVLPFHLVTAACPRPYSAEGHVGSTPATSPPTAKDCAGPKGHAHLLPTTFLLDQEPDGGLDTKSCLTLVTPWTVAYQAPLSVEFPRQGHWSGLAFPSPGESSQPKVSNPGLLHCRQILYRLSYQGFPTGIWGTQCSLPVLV